MITFLVFVILLALLWPDHIGSIAATAGLVVFWFVACTLGAGLMIGILFAAFG